MPITNYLDVLCLEYELEEYMICGGISDVLRCCVDNVSGQLAKLFDDEITKTGVNPKFHPPGGKGDA